MQPSIQNIEKHMGQLAASMVERQQGSLPSNTETNSCEHLQAITLRSGRKVEVRSNTTPCNEKGKTLVRGTTSVDVGGGLMTAMII